MQNEIEYELGMVETTSPIWSRSERKKGGKIKQKLYEKQRIELLRCREVWRIIQRIVVFPALSRPRTRIRASLLPKTDENNLVNTNPIFRFSSRGIMIRTWNESIRCKRLVLRILRLFWNQIRSQSRSSESEVHAMRLKNLWCGEGRVRFLEGETIEEWDREWKRNLWFRFPHPPPRFCYGIDRSIYCYFFSRI